MKRILQSGALLLLVAVIIGYILGASQFVTRRNLGQILLLVALNIVIGVAISNALFALGARVLRSRLSAPSTFTKQAIGVGIATFGLVLAVVCNHVAGQFLRKILFGYKYSSHLLISNVDGFLYSFLTVGLLFTVVYVFHRLYEERIGQRVRTPGRRVPKYYRLKMAIKLLIAAMFVFFLALVTTSGNWSTPFQTDFEQDLGSIWKEREDSLAYVSLRGTPLSQETYLRAVLGICKDLNVRPPGVILVPFPEELVRSKKNLALVGQLAIIPNVIFSVQPQDQSEQTERWVENPVKGIAHFDWGVSSAVMDKSLRRPYRYFPLGYKEVAEGYTVPDAAIRAVGKFRGNSVNANGFIVDHRYRLGDYETGLFENYSATIWQRLNPYMVETLYAYVEEGAERPSYAILASGSEQLRRGIPDTVLAKFEHRIVIVEQERSTKETELFGWKEPFSWTQARIIHQILRNESSIPLDAWTGWIIGGVLIICMLSMLFLRPLLASFLIFVFSTFGLPWLFFRLVSHYGIIVEFLPPIVAGLFSILFFLLVRIMHERRQLEVDEKERIVQELKSAHDMQMGLLPSEDPNIPGYEISGICKPADEVGGDFFDYVWLDDKKNRLGIAIGDVSGKAMKAAITAVLTSGMVYREVGTNETPKSILRKINRPMYLKTERRMFTAMMFAVIDIRKKKLTFSNAGQMQPMLKRRGKTQLLSVDGVRFPLGMMEDADYHEVAIPLRPKDVMVFYTDGIPEAMNAKDEMFGFERLEKIVEQSSAQLSAKQLAKDITVNVAEFAGSTKQHDDMTVVVLKVL